MVHISYSNSKLGPQIPSINLPPQCTCSPGLPCSEKCYARKGHFLFNNVKKSMADNLKEWNENHDLYMAAIILNAGCNRFFRWHAAGDIPSMDYLKMMVRVAEELPQTSFLCFTKKFGLINRYLDENNGEFPGNMHIVLSAWGTWLPENPHNLPTAFVKLKDSSGNETPSNAIKCSGYCGKCVMGNRSCWSLTRGQSVIFDEH